MGSGVQVDKFCKDCKHFDISGYCNKVPMLKDLVTGTVSYGWENNTYYQRNIVFLIDIIDKACGRRGRFWESKNG